MNKKSKLKLIRQLLREGTYSKALEELSAIVVMDKVGINSPSSVEKYFEEYKYKSQEYFVVLTLDAEHKPIQRHEVSKGILNTALVHPREIFYCAIRDNAKSIIVGHNHPSGSLAMSNEDREVQERIKAAGELMGITLLDFLIVSRNGFYSSCNEGTF